MDKFKGAGYEVISKPDLIKIMGKHPGTRTPHVNSINWRISLYRLHLELNQNKFSKLLGISQGSICDIESGKSDPCCLTIQKIARIKKKPVDIMWLLLG